MNLPPRFEAGLSYADPDDNTDDALVEQVREHLGHPLLAEGEVIEEAVDNLQRDFFQFASSLGVVERSRRALEHAVRRS